MDYETAERRLFSLINYEKTPSKGPKSLLSFLNLLSSFNHPEDSLSKNIIVKGTKGKGSTSMILHQICLNNNVFPGLFTSPHLFSVRERIKAGSTFISKDDFASIIGGIFNELDTQRGFRTYFEVLTLLAIEYFNQVSTDLNIFEAGLGGRLDTSRLIPSKATILTEIGFDHTSLLGPLLMDITFEKMCGAENSLLITQVQHPAVERTITSLKAQRNINLIRQGVDFKVVEEVFNKEQSDIILDTKNFGKIHINIPLPGRFLVKSAMLACMAAKYTECNECNLYGLELPARFQKVSNEPTIIIDGSHNPMSIQNLKRELEFYYGNNKGKKILIFGMMKDKNVRQALTILKDFFDLFIFVEASVTRSMCAEDIQAIFRQISDKKSIIMEQEEALDFVEKEGDFTIITGSFFVAGDFLRILVERNKYPYKGLYMALN